LNDFYRIYGSGASSGFLAEDSIVSYFSAGDSDATISSFSSSGGIITCKIFLLIAFSILGSSIFTSSILGSSSFTSTILSSSSFSSSILGSSSFASSILGSSIFTSFYEGYLFG